MTFVSFTSSNCACQFTWHNWRAHPGMQNAKRWLKERLKNFLEYSSQTTIKMWSTIDWVLISMECLSLLPDSRNLTWEYQAKHVHPLHHLMLYRNSNIDSNFFTHEGFPFSFAATFRPTTARLLPSIDSNWEISGGVHGMEEVDYSAKLRRPKKGRVTARPQNKRWTYTRVSDEIPTPPFTSPRC